MVLTYFSWCIVTIHTFGSNSIYCDISIYLQWLNHVIDVYISMIFLLWTLNIFPRYSVFHTRKVESLNPSITRTKISPKTKTHKRRKILMNMQLIVVIIFMPCTIENINIIFYIWIEMSIYFSIYFHLKCNIIIFLLKNLQVLFLLI